MVITAIALQKIKLQDSSIQFNSKTLFKDGDPVSFKTYLPWGYPKSQANTTYTFIQNINTHT